MGELEVKREIFFLEIIPEFFHHVLPKRIKFTGVFHPHDDNEVVPSFGGRDPVRVVVCYKIVDDFVLNTRGSILIGEIDTVADVTEFEGIDNGVVALDDSFFFKSFYPVLDNVFWEVDFFPYLGE